MNNLKGNTAAQFGLLSAAGAMLNPTDNLGTALSRGIHAGVNTYVPMMQWQQRRDERKADKNYRKQQDLLRNTLAERQFKLRNKVFESEMQNREDRLNLSRAQFGAQMDQQALVNDLNERKFAETQFKNRLPDASGSPGARGVKATDERFIAGEVSRLFEGDYDVRTGMITIKDDDNRRLAQKITKEAVRLAANNPKMTRSQAVNTAAERNGIAINSPSSTLATPPAAQNDPLGWRK